MTFHNSDHHFHHQVTPDTGASKTIFVKNILDKQKIKFFPKPDNLDLYTAAGEPMTVNGQVQLTATFKDKSKLIEGLVSEDLNNEILMSWYDCEDLGSVSIARSVSLQNPSAQIETIKKKYESILRNNLSDSPMKGPPMKVHFKKEALEKGIRPKKIFTASQTPLHLKPAADKVLAEAIESKLIEEVPINEPSDWCSRGFFVTKPNGGARLVVDLSYLNSFIERPCPPICGWH